LKAATAPGLPNAASPGAYLPAMPSTSAPDIARATGAMAVPPAAAPPSVRVQAPGRLHLGFLDPSGSLGRRFGSLGLVIDGFETALELSLAAREEDFAADARCMAELPRARGHLQALRQATGCNAPLRLRLLGALPAHAGLGSGTQLALAVGRAFACVFGLSLTSMALARLTGRGLRSGVGIAGFDQGGLLLDGGPGAAGAPAALLSRIELPAEWRVLVALDPQARGLSGADEKSALARLPALPRKAAAALCHQTLMRVLPGAAGAEFEVFAEGLAHIQHLLGDHFAPVQQGRAYTSPSVGRLMVWLASHRTAVGPTAVGQSSWGPAGFAVWPSEAAAQAAVAAARAAGVLDAALALRVVRPRNHGAVVTPLMAPAEAQAGSALQALALSPPAC
jgi:beta-RFAP synthase